MHYAHNLRPGLNVFMATIVLLGIFAFLNLIGIGESAIVAVLLFAIHIVTLTILVGSAGLMVSQDVSTLIANWQSPPPGGMLKAVFFGFSAAMLGISGFESSANFVEEQQEGVFPKTLRNMWIAVAIFNPLISFLSLGVMPLKDIAANKEDLLADLGMLTAGHWLQTLVSVDATLVLSGAVLTSYVGVTGLVRRMTLDRCLPQFLLRENQWRGTNHWIILLFFVLCCSVLMITQGRIEMLAGVYTISFLGVMSLFAIGNILLKIKRARLPRAAHATWPAVIVALIAVLLGLAGNLQLNPTYVKVFAIYFLVALAVVGIMFLRVEILKGALAVVQVVIEEIRAMNRQISHWLVGKIDQINSQSVIFFSKGDNLVTLNRAALYVLANEQTKRLRVIHCYDQEENIPPELAQQIGIIDRIYPELKIDLILVKGRFSPDLIEQLSQRLQVPKNYMFLGTPGDHFPHNIAELGGVRLIM
jgi:amino acid transporter